MPDLVLVAPQPSARPGFDPSAFIEQNLPSQEVPSQGRLEGNIIAGGDTKVIIVPAGAVGIEAALFKNRADLKLVTSRVAMHLTNEQRHSIFSAIDRLLSLTDWEDDSAEIDERAFRSFLRFAIYARPRQIPNLGVSPDGGLLAGWHADGKSVHVEFLPDDQCMALVRSQSARGPERIARRGHVAGLREFIENNAAVECID